ncbi:hypothetical protein GCM10010421_54510 [Streptomyces glaucus]|uniref:Secreted protein n=1 Tax=Streptomyces glaucus TaxID=284029 RepID=A0ABN3KB11_9ACTN
MHVGHLGRTPPARGPDRSASGNEPYERVPFPASEGGPGAGGAFGVPHVHGAGNGGALHALAALVTAVAGSGRGLVLVDALAIRRGPAPRPPSGKPVRAGPPLT